MYLYIYLFIYLSIYLSIYLETPLSIDSNFVVVVEFVTLSLMLALNT